MTRNALITGGAGDIGMACAAHLAAMGITVALTDVDAGAAQQAVERLPGEGHVAFGLDVTREGDVQSIFAQAEAKLGSIDILVHSAGIIDGAGPLNGIMVSDMTSETWQKVFLVNSFGTFLCVREFIRLRRLSPVADGRIITFSSLAGQMGGYLAGAAYAASKAAIIGFTKNVAREVAPLGITANVIAPGPIESRMNRQAAGIQRDDSVSIIRAPDTIPMDRKGRPDEVAALVGYLASPQSSYITGQTIGINGGMYM